MKLNAVAVTSRDLPYTLQFYSLLGFAFPEYKQGERHIESKEREGSIKLMIDSFDMIEEILGYPPKPANHSVFAIEYRGPHEVNEIVEKIKAASYKIVKGPWDAFWGQRYAIVEDPDGYKVDLYALL